MYRSLRALGVTSCILGLICTIAMAAVCLASQEVNSSTTPPYWLKLWGLTTGALYSFGIFLLVLSCNWFLNRKYKKEVIKKISEALGLFLFEENSMELRTKVRNKVRSILYPYKKVGFEQIYSTCSKRIPPQSVVDNGQLILRCGYYFKKHFVDLGIIVGPDYVRIHEF